MVKIEVILIVPRPACGLEGRGNFYCQLIAHDEINVHCSPAKKVFFHNSQLHNERLLDKSQNP